MNAVIAAVYAEADLITNLRNGAHRVAHTASTWFTSVVNDGGPLLVAVLILAAAILIGYAVSVIVLRNKSDLQEALEPYKLHRKTRKAAKEGPTPPVIRRVAAALSKLVEDRGLLPALELQLARAGLPIQAGEFLLCCLGLAVVALFVGLLIAGLLGLIIGVIVAVVGPIATVKAMSDIRLRKFNSQLPDALKLLASSLRAGFSLMQGFDSLAQQVKDPMQRELRRAVASARIGEPLEDALETVADRVGSKDFTWTSMAIRIQREVGGNLAEILDTVANTMVERERLRRQVRTLTAEGRISAIIVGLLPLFLGAFILAVNPDYIKQLTKTFPGEVALVLGILLEIAGAWWMYRTVQIEV